MSTRTAFAELLLLASRLVEQQPSLPATGQDLLLAAPRGLRFVYDARWLAMMRSSTSLRWST